MNETMVYADGFEKTFATAEEMLDFLSRRGKASEWIRKPIRALRLVPLEKEADNLDNGDAEMEEILKDTEKHTRLVLKVRGEAYPVRNCAIQTILGRAGIGGDGLRKLDLATYATPVAAISTPFADNVPSISPIGIPIPQRIRSCKETRR